MEFDASIKGAHVPMYSTRLQGLNIGLVEVTNSMPGQADREIPHQGQRRQPARAEHSAR
jgi:hypothetical protein